MTRSGVTSEVNGRSTNGPQPPLNVANLPQIANDPGAHKMHFLMEWTTHTSRMGKTAQGDRLEHHRLYAWRNLPLV